MSFTQGIVTHVVPQLYDKDSPECAAVPPALLAPAAAAGATPEVPVFEAVPIPSMQNIVTPCEALDGCGP